MPKLFLSHASADFTAVERFVALLEDGLGFKRSDIRCSSLPGYGFPIGSPFREEIREELTSADVIICIVSSAFLASSYCLGELGVAWGLRRSLLPLALPSVRPADLEGILQDLNVPDLYDAGTLDVLREQLGSLAGPTVDSIRWEARRQRFLAERQDEEPRDEIWRWRGFWSERVVDGTLYIAPDLPSVGLRQQVRDALEKGRGLPPHLFYVTDQGFESWLALSDDDRYLAFQDSLALLRESSEAMVAEIFDAVGTKCLDFISLGPGNGRKDVYLLRAMVELRGDAPADLYYYPFDVSANMVAKAMTRVAGERSIKHRLGQVKAIVADFNSLPIFKAVYQYREGPNLLVFLGNTLGNFADDFEFLERLHDRAMFKDDLLLLEVRLRPTADDPVKALGDESINKRFDFGPLELLGVPFDEEKLTYRVEEERGTIRGTVTTVAEYQEVRINGRPRERVPLSYVHGYEREQLLKAVRRVGFRVVGDWLSPQQHNCWVLLQKVGI